LRTKDENAGDARRPVMRNKTWNTLLRTVPALLGAAAVLLLCLNPGRDGKVVSAQSADDPSVKAALSIQGAFRSVAKSVTPAVVNISSETVIRNEWRSMPEDPFMQFFGQDFFEHFFDVPRESKQRALGTGFLVSEDGYLISNLHVIQNASKIQVTLADGTRHKARVVGMDQKTDLALLKIDAKNLPFVRLGDSEAVEVGDWAVAIGNPFGLSETFTVGVISAKGRKDVGLGEYENYLQTDAAINPGNSGGPLVDISGAVIGVNTAIASPSGGNVGIGFAIPVNVVKTVFDQLRTKGKVVRGWAGLFIQDLTEEVAKPLQVRPGSGVLVADTAPDGPAAAAGIRTGDIILEFNSRPVGNAEELRALVAAAEVGKQARLKVLRSGKSIDVEIRIAEMPSGETQAQAGATAQSWLGFTAVNLTPELKQKYGIRAQGTEGVVVTALEQTGPAAEAGMREGDLVLRINNTAIASASDLARFVEKNGSSSSFLFLVRRQDRTFFIGIEPER
jgi:serine protease Do